jgi:hypothetical protein
MLAMAMGYALVFRRGWKEQQLDPRGSLDLILCSMLVIFTFYPFYKYYFVGIVPLMVLLVRSKTGAAGFIAYSFALMLVPRYFASWVLLALLVWVWWRGASRHRTLNGTEARSHVDSLAPRSP